MPFTLTFCQVYNCELEKVEQFQGLTDFCRTINLHQGKTVDDDEDPSVVGQFKVSVSNAELKYLLLLSLIAMQLGFFLLARACSLVDDLTAFTCFLFYLP